MKQAKIVRVDGPDRVTVEFTHDDGSVTVTENLGPAPVGDGAALLDYLVRYEAAYVAGLAQAAPAVAVPSAPVEAGFVLTPAAPQA